ncbi:sugar O-acetyltransferase [Pediococcus siamensis]|uniref:sugar O-acetyltransferase n=1 Tax=Pediococcus siamensis TaxID=381829 RepID=UPI00399FAA13
MNLEEKFEYMATGKPYDDLDPRLVRLRARATTATNKLNDAGTAVKKEVLLRNLMGSVGKNPTIEPNFRCEFGRNIVIGDNFYANYDCVMLDGAPIKIGNNVLLGPKVGLYTSNHLFDSIERRMGGCIAKPIHIEDDVWIAANVTILPGVRIGKGSIVGGGSVVTRDIPSCVIAAGNPCRVIRKITSEDKTKFNGNDFTDR